MNNISITFFEKEQNKEEKEDYINRCLKDNKIPLIKINKDSKNTNNIFAYYSTMLNTSFNFFIIEIQYPKINC